VSAVEWEWRDTFAALRIRHFRWLWLAALAGSTTFQMGTVAQGWLVYELSGSAFILGWVSTGWSIATLFFALYGGVMADRLEKRSIMLGARGLMMLNTLFIAVLISFNLIQIWHLLLNSILAGLAYSFIMPAQNAWIAELIDRRTLLNAAALSSVGMGLMGIFSAWAAGQIIEAHGVSGVYYAMFGMYSIAIFSISRLPATGVIDDGSTSSVWGDLLAGVRYLVDNPLMLGLLLLSFARVLFAMPYRTFMPKFSSEVMGFDAAGLGILMAAPGVGALISSMVVASLGDFRHKGTLLLASGVLTGAGLALFAGVPLWPLTLLFLVLVGGGENNAMVVTNALLQTYADPRYRARAMSMLMLVWGFTPLGVLPAGAIADRIGVPLVVGVQGTLLIASFVAVWFWRPEIRVVE
jgi:MFS family permease